MGEFLSFTEDEWGKDGIGGGPCCFGRLVQVLSGSGHGSGGSGGEETTTNPMGGTNSGKAGDSKAAAPAPYSPLFANKQIAPAENPPVPQTRIMGSPDARVAPETQPPVPLAGGMCCYLLCCAVLCCIVLSPYLYTIISIATVMTLLTVCI